MKNPFPFLAFSVLFKVPEQASIKEHSTKPNIIVILTDDQDLHMQSLDYMPLLKQHITDQGTFFKRHYCSTAICCPSRVTLWTGRNAHNTNVTDVIPPYGFNEAYLPIWLQEAGYNTYYTGKLFNGLTTTNWNSLHPAGWNSSDFLLDPHTYDYLNATFQRNLEPPLSYLGQYSTDVLAEKAYGLLEEAAHSEKPFFLTLAPVAPHSNISPDVFTTGDTAAQTLFSTPIPAERHKDLFPNVKVPRTANFNPVQPGGASWIKQLPFLTEEVLTYNDDFYRARLQALQAVDEIVPNLISRLENHGVLDNTYIIFTSDNGFHISQHRLNPGKECGFEEDINIPLIIRGPGVPVGQSDVVTAHTDFAPTILKIAGGAYQRSDFDGSPISLHSGEMERGGEHVNVEFWGMALAEGKYGFTLGNETVASAPNNTYKALRIAGGKFNLYYSVWCTNEHELYDLSSDPYQITNLYPTPPLSPSTTLNSTPLTALLPRLDALLMVLKSCIGSTCTNPWSVIHPQGDVHTLETALDQKYDRFYETESTKIRFEKCELGYIIGSEGPQTGGIYGMERESHGQIVLDDYICNDDKRI